MSADPFRALRQFERHMLSLPRPVADPLDGARLIGTIIFDDEAQTVEYHRVDEASPPSLDAGERERND